MRYLAAAWNSHDYAAICRVSDPNARSLLVDMHREAVNLRFSRCQSEGGMYTCYFRHDYPRSMHRKGIGHAEFDVAPADDPGWYVTVVGCG